MNTTETLRSVLESSPGEWSTYLVLADRFQEDDDPAVRVLALGYRALATIRRRPVHGYGTPWGDYSDRQDEDQYSHYAWWAVTSSALLTGANCQLNSSGLPRPWFFKIETGHFYVADGAASKDFFTFREALDGAALAFSRLAPGEQTEALSWTGEPWWTTADYDAHAEDRA